MGAVRGLFLFFSVLFLTACSHDSLAPVAGQSCSSNPYLAKYQCSLSRVQVAAKAGDPDAAYALGYMYYYGIDTPPDLDKADVWIARAAAQGQVLAKQAQRVMGSTQVHSVPRTHASRLSSNGYTLQLMASHHLGDILNFIKVHHLQQRTTYYAVTGQGGTLYRLIYGEYPTLLEARAAAHELSHEIPGLMPWVKPNQTVTAQARGIHVR